MSTMIDKLEANYSNAVALRVAAEHDLKKKRDYLQRKSFQKLPRNKQIQKVKRVKSSELRLKQLKGREEQVKNQLDKFKQEATNG